MHPLDPSHQTQMGALIGRAFTPRRVSGIHHCFGASLARPEPCIAREERLKRSPDYELTESPRHFVSATFHGFEALPIACPS